MYVPTKVFFTRGAGKHKEKLASFEMALRACGIAHLNLVRVSSIFPPGCQTVKREQGLKLLKPGQIVHVVMAEAATNEPRRLLASSIGVAVPRDPDQFGYLSEFHGFGITDDKAGEYAEDLAAEMFATIMGVEKKAGDYAESLAAEMLATVMGVEFDAEKSWDEKREIWRISGKLLKTNNIAQSALGDKNGWWTTTLAAAVLLP